MKMYVSTANKGTLNLREGPSISSKILIQIPYNTSLDAELQGEWAKVSYKNYKGYVKSEFLKAEATDSTVTKSDLKKIYDGLQATLKTIENILK